MVNLDATTWILNIQTPNDPDEGTRERIDRVSGGQELRFSSIFQRILAQILDQHNSTPFFIEKELESYF